MWVGQSLLVEELLVQSEARCDSLRPAREVKVRGLSELVEDGAVGDFGVAIIQYSAEVAPPKPCGCCTTVIVDGGPWLLLPAPPGGPPPTWWSSSAPRMAPPPPRAWALGKVFQSVSKTRFS